MSRNILTSNGNEISLMPFKHIVDDIGFGANYTAREVKQHVGGLLHVESRARSRGDRNLTKRYDGAYAKKMHYTNCSQHSGPKGVMHRGKGWRQNERLADTRKGMFGMTTPFVCPSNKVMNKLGIRWSKNEMWWEGECCNISYY